MAENKNQHYVPQLYLRHFSRDKKTITVFSIRENRIVSTNAPIDNQCSKDYLYGKDLILEKALADLETNSAPIIKYVIESSTLPMKGSPEYLTLMIFLLYQYARTISAADQLNEMTEKIAKNLLKDHIRRTKPEEITIGDLDAVKIFHPKAANLNLRTVALQIPLILDLESSLLINKTEVELITSDNPVILYNNYYSKEPLSYLGLASKGLLIFFPLTPNHYIILYDAKIYQIGEPESSKAIFLKQENDINQLNILQLINSNKTAYTLGNSQDYFQSLMQIATKYRADEKITVNDSELHNEPDGKESKLLWSSKNRIGFDIDLSLLRIRENINPDYLAQHLIRNPLLVELHREFTKLVDRKVYKPSDWPLFLEKKINNEESATR